MGAIAILQKGMDEKSKLEQEIKQAVVEVARDKEMQKVKSLSRYNPERVAKVLYLSSIGVSQTSIVRKYDIPRAVVISILVDYADYKNKFRELGAKISARSYMNLESLEEDIVENVREQIQIGEYQPTPKDIKEISIAKSNSARHAMVSRGEASSITENRNVVTDEDYNDTIEKAKNRIKKIKGEIIDNE
jgi:hypothetical protein